LRAHLATSSRALTHRNYRLFFFGQAVSLIGSWTQMVAQGWLVYDLTGQGSWLGLVGFAQQAPIFFLGLITGTLLDRADKRLVVLANQIGLFICAVTLALMTWTEVVRPEYVLVVAFCIGIINAFDIPGRQSWMIELVGREDLPNAIALNSTTFNLARLLGPAIAGVVLAFAGPAWCFALNACTSIAVIAGILRMDRSERPVRTPGGSAFADLKRGFVFIKGHPMVRSMLMLLGTVAIFTMPVQVLMPIFAETIHGVGPGGLGLMVSCIGGGALLGALRLVILPSSAERLRRVPAEAAATLGISLILFATSPVFPVACALLVPAGFAMVTVGGSANTAVQAAIPDDLRGRVMAIYASVFVGLIPFGSVAAGFAADRIGAPATVAIGGVVCTLYALWRRSRIR
jgi:MFS family permease